MFIKIDGVIYDSDSIEFIKSVDYDDIYSGRHIRCDIAMCGQEDISKTFESSHDLETFMVKLELVLEVKSI